MHLSCWFCADKNAVCPSRSTVRQFNHFITLLWTSEFTHVSPFLSVVAKNHFSWCTFLNVWKRLLFAVDGFPGSSSKDLDMLSVVYETFSQMALRFRSTRLAASRKLWRNFFCFVSFAQSTSKSKSALFSVFCTCAMCPKVTSASSSTDALATLGKKWKGSVCCCCFSRMTESVTLERLSVFPERAIDFYDFPEQIQ